MEAAGGPDGLVIPPESFVRNVHPYVETPFKNPQTDHFLEWLNKFADIAAETESQQDHGRTKFAKTEEEPSTMPFMTDLAAQGEPQPIPTTTSAPQQNPEEIALDLD